MTDHQVVLHRSGPSYPIHPSAVFFAFANGRLSYDCVRCNAQCCRGHGYSPQTATELSAQLELRPSVKFFLDYGEKEPGEAHLVRNCPPACFFLKQDGSGATHAEQRYASKPETCRLFPFNACMRVGQHLIVAPHDRLFPLEVLPLGTTSPKSDYRHLLEEMSAKGIGTDNPIGTINHSDLSENIALERCIVPLSEKHLCSRRYAEFFRVQCNVSQERGFDDLPEGTVRLDATRCVELMSEVMDVRATDLDPEQPDLVRTMMAVTPFLRSKLLFREVGRRGITLEIATSRIPHFVMAVHAVAAPGSAAGMRVIMFQTSVEALRHWLTKRRMPLEVRRSEERGGKSFG